jgi:hypothetical protein
VILPRDELSRLLLVEQLVRECTASRIDRFNFYQVVRNYCMFGTMDQQGCPYNKIKATLESLTSFIYSPDTVRFSLHLGVQAPKLDYPKAPVLGKEVTDVWHKSGTSLLFGKAVWWALVYGCMLVKNYWIQGGMRTYLVEPHQFGVQREDITDLEDQEAFTHHYVVTRADLDRALQGNPRQKAIMNRVGRSLVDQLPPISSGLQRLIVGSPVAGVPGSAAIPGTGNMVGPGGLGGRGGPVYDYTPKLEVELIDMCDLYVWDDEAEDYNVFTRAAPDVTIYDRPASWLGHVRGVPAFTAIRSSDVLYDYFWGDSLVADLTWLQDWRTERIMDVRQTLRKQFKPPMSVTGGTGITEEKLLALYSAGGQVSFPTPNAKVNTHEPKMPEDVFAEMQQIDGMFDDIAGISHILQGRGEAGVRSKGQVDLMARLSSSRPKKRALTIEGSAEDLAHNQLLLTQEHSAHRFEVTVGGKPWPFTAEQFTRDYVVKVDGHSSSPIFVEDRKHDAVTLLEAKAIDRSTVLEMFDPPNVQDLQERLKVIEQKEAEAQKMELQLQLSSGKPPARSAHHGKR